jgi:O-antigen ligase
VIASLVLGVVAVISFGFGQLPWFPTPPAPITAQLGGLFIFLLSIGAFLFAAHQIKTQKELEWLVLVFLGIGFAFFTFRLYPPLLPTVSRIFVRQGVLGAAFYIWLVAIAFSQAVFNKKLAPVWRVAAGLLVVMIFFVNMRGESRYWVSGWMPPMVTLVAIIVLGRPDLGFFAVMGGLVVLAVNTNILDTIMSEGDNSYSTITRLEAWRILWEIIKANPVFGLGMANYYFYTPLFPILGYKVSFNSHNNYIDIVAQIGLLGLVCLLWLFAELWRLGWRMRTQIPEGFPRAYVIGALGGLVGTAASGMLGDWFLPFVYNVGMDGLRASIFVWIFLGGLVALAHIYSISSTGAEAQSG